jgi:hypothetical protein
MSVEMHITTGREAQLLQGISDAALQLTKVIEQIRSGIRDGDGAMRATASKLRCSIDEYLAAQREAAQCQRISDEHLLSLLDDIAKCNFPQDAHSFLASMSNTLNALDGLSRVPDDATAIEKGGLVRLYCGWVIRSGTPAADRVIARDQERHHDRTLPF